MPASQPLEAPSDAQAETPSLAGRANALLAFTRGDHADTFATFTSFLAILCLHVGLRHVHLGIRFDEPAFFVSGAINLAAAAGVFFERRAEVLRYSPALLAISVVIFAYVKPGLGNHALMESLLLLAVAIAIPIRADRVAPIADLFRWSAILLFLHAGLQKIAYGAYFNGSFLARQVQSDRFGWVLELALPQKEYVRLLFADRAGPMVIESFSGLALSNMVYASEIACAALLLIPRTRAFGVYAAIAAVIGIEVVAREVGFGLMFIFMLLLFRPQTYATRAILVLPIAAHLALGLFELIRPGVLHW